MPMLSALGTEKKIVTAGKKKGCEVLQKWSHSISNHMYWCAASSGGDGETMVQKWLSMLNHVRNVHEGHGDLFPKCLHGPLDNERKRKWLVDGKYCILNYHYLCIQTKNTF